jgi:hypothetical protein
LGLLLAAIVNNSTKDRNDTGCYRIPVAVQFAWALILITGMLILPETPRFLIKKGKPEAAAKSLARLRRLPIDNPVLTAELAEIQANHEYELSLGQASYIEILRGTLGKRLATGCGVQALQQLAGVNFICKSNLLLRFLSRLAKLSSSLLRHLLLPKLRHPKLLRRHPNHQHYQRLLHIPRSVHGREMGPSSAAALRCGRHVRVSADRGHRRHGRILRRRQQGAYRLRMYLHLLLRQLLGSRGVGRDGGVVPLEGAREMPVHHHGHELAAQLGDRLRNPLHGELGPGQRKPAVEGVLHLGRVLLRLHDLRLHVHLRDERAEFGGGRRTVRQGVGGVAVARVRAIRQLLRCEGCGGRK